MQADVVRTLRRLGYIAFAVFIGLGSRAAMAQVVDPEVPSKKEVIALLDQWQSLAERDPDAFKFLEEGLEIFAPEASEALPPTVPEPAGELTVFCGVGFSRSA